MQKKFLVDKHAHFTGAFRLSERLSPASLMALAHLRVLLKFRGKAK